jgi:hypothetical protein
VAGQIRQRHEGNRDDNEEQRDRSARQELFAQPQKGEAGETDAYDDWMRLEQLAGVRNHAPDKVDESNPNHSSQLTCPLFRHPAIRLD